MKLGIMLIQQNGGNRLSFKSPDLISLRQLARFLVPCMIFLVLSGASVQSGSCELSLSQAVPLLHLSAPLAMLVTVTVHGVTAGCCDCWSLPFLDTLYSTLWDYDSKTVRPSLLVRSSSKPLNPVSWAYRSSAIVIVDYLQSLERQPQATAIASFILGSLRLQ